MDDRRGLGGGVPNDTPLCAGAVLTTARQASPGVLTPPGEKLCKEQNERVAAWERGEIKPRAVKAFSKAQTFGALLDRYEAEKLPLLRASTQRVDKVAIRRLRDWAGKHPVTWITQERVLALRSQLMKGVTLDGPGHAPAFHLLATLRRIFTWAMKEASPRVALPGGINPAAHFGLRMPRAASGSLGR